MTHDGWRSFVAAESKVRILIAERNPLVIAALRGLIERDDRFQLIGSVQTGEAFLEAAAAPSGNGVVTMIPVARTSHSTLPSWPGNCPT